ncbi:MAG TPA: GDSL family lipase [Gammaproteobacteria bacterium]|nr:GDSL family lipase [Gammaproteobacteria bacterium]
MTRQQTPVRLTTLLYVLALLFSLPAQADRRYSDLVFFGDSLSDPGNAFVLTGEVSRRPFQLIPDAPYARGGHHFSNGRTWAEQFARELHQRSGPALRRPDRFSNYAVGSARARAEGSVHLATQVALYLGNRGGADPHALYTLLIGGNDLRDALTALATDPSGAGSAAILGEAVTAIADNIAALAAAGARHFLVFNGPDLSLVPAVRLQGPLAQGAARLLAMQFNQGLSMALDQLALAFPGIELTRFDLFGLFNEVVANPRAFGFREVGQTCITPGVIVGAVCKRPRRYLFWDGIHPTRAGHHVIAEAVEERLED